MPVTAPKLILSAELLRAQSLATMMAAVDPVSGVDAATLEPKASGTPATPPLTGEASREAVILGRLTGNRIAIALNGQPMELPLDAETAEIFARHPGLARPGARLPLITDPQSGALRLVLPKSLPPTPQDPATLLSLSEAILSKGTPATSVDAPPRLPNPFPPGTLGAVIAKALGMPVAPAEAESSAAPLRVGPESQIRTPTLPTALPPALGDAALRALARQLPLAPSLASLIASASDEATPLPPSIREQVANLAATRLPAEALSNPVLLRHAVDRSGLFLESKLAQITRAGLATPSPEGTLPPQPLIRDLKAQLLALQAALLPMPEADMKPAARHLQTPAQDSSAPLAPRTQAEQDVAPSLPRLVEGALERVKLMQMASLPAHPDMAVTDDRGQAMRLAVTIPVATQGAERPETAMMGLVIEHRPPALPGQPDIEDEAGANEADPFPWKVRIALDLEETGPVQVEIGLRGQSVAVTLWAERTTMAEEAQASIGDLHRALTEAAFDVAKLDIKAGRPTAPPPRGPVLDRRT